MRVYELHMKNGEVIRVEHDPESLAKAGAIFIDSVGHASVCRGMVTHAGDWDRIDIYPAGEWTSLRISTEVTRGG